jgi:hypothetical protein
LIVASVTASQGCKPRAKFMSIWSIRITSAGTKWPFVPLKRLWWQVSEPAELVEGSR